MLYKKEIEEKQKNKKARIVLLSIAFLYLAFAIFYNYFPEMQDPFSLAQRVLGASLFLVCFILSYFSNWILLNLNKITVIVAYLAIGHLVAITYIESYPFDLAVSLIIILAFANIFFKVDRLVLYSNILLGFSVALTLLLINKSSSFILSYSLTYVTVVIFTFYVSYQSHQNDKKIKKHKETFESLIENMSSGFAHHKIIIDKKGEPIDYTFLLVNNAFEEITGLKRENIIGKKVTEVLECLSTEQWINTYGKVTLTKKSISFEHYSTPLERWYKVNAYSQNKGYFTTIFNDITEQKNNEKKLKKLSFNDQLTGLYNRRFFEEEMNRLNKSRKIPISILVADIDNSKKINDNYGHQTGDLFFEKAGAILNNSLRADDILARIGGDEFSVILPDTDNNKVKKIYDRIKIEISNFNKNSSLPEPLKISLGFDTKNSYNQNLNTIFNNADQMMYKNKKRNKNVSK